MSEISGSVPTGILIILDGFGLNPDEKHNAVAMAKTPTLDRLFETYPHGSLNASESHVGLPNGFMGNSEVGHLNIGAGRIVRQDFSLISREIEEGTFFDNSELMAAMEGREGHKKTSTLHLMGLVSDGGVHSHDSHLVALLEMAKQKGVAEVAVHVFTDGRDTSPTSGVGFLEKLQSEMDRIGVGRIATVCGRFYGMDRDKRWERTEAAYNALVAGKAAHQFTDPIAYLRTSYQEEVTDEFIIPGVAKGYQGFRDGDSVIFFNFRADRARQITAAMTQTDFPHFRRENFPTLAKFVAFTHYDDALKVSVAFAKPEVTRTLGEVVSNLGWKQLRIAETEKYAHVTYFFSGGKETVFEGEERVLIPSPRSVRTYDQKPEMSAVELTDRLLKALEETPFQMVVVNFANPDMVGHTGNLSAAIRAVETVDACLGRIVDWVESHHAFALLTADHGNCEQMQDSHGAPLTSHTLLPVPLVLIDKNRRSSSIKENGRLCDIAPTMLSLWGEKIPTEMTGTPLVNA